MARLKGILKSTILFLIGFYIRGIVDSYSVQQRFHNADDDRMVTQEAVSGGAYHKSFIQNDYNYDDLHLEQGNGKESFFVEEEVEPQDNRTHWCVVTSKYLPKTTRGHFDHFPHAAEIILPCWSYFVKQNAVDRCGYAIANQNFKLPSWIQELVDAMGCKVQYGKGLPKGSHLADFVPEGDVQHIPNYYLLRPRLDYIRYLDHPEHAHMLRRLFVDDDYIKQMKGDGKLKQIGIIQREGARRFDNLDKILRTLHKDIKESQANITVTDFKFKTVKEQASWFATKDMIIASHGAALTNSIFITPGTIVMQMYPPGYFLQTLEVRRVTFRNYV